jgi:hypothetical protein
VPISSKLTGEPLDATQSPRGEQRPTAALAAALLPAKETS